MITHAEIKEQKKEALKAFEAFEDALIEHGFFKNECFFVSEFTVAYQEHLSFDMLSIIANGCKKRAMNIIKRPSGNMRGSGLNAHSMALINNRRLFLEMATMINQHGITRAEGGFEVKRSKAEKEPKSLRQGMTDRQYIALMQGLLRKHRNKLAAPMLVENLLKTPRNIADKARMYDSMVSELKQCQ